LKIYSYYYDTKKRKKKQLVPVPKKEKQKFFFFWHQLWSQIFFWTGQWYTRSLAKNRKNL